MTFIISRPAFATAPYPIAFKAHTTGYCSSLPRFSGIAPLNYDVYAETPRAAKLNARFRKNHPQEQGVLVYGSSGRTRSNSKASCQELGRLIAQQGWHVVTGGAEGTMRYVAEGAIKAGGHTVGVGLENLAVPDGYFVKEVNPEFYAAGLLEERNRLYDNRGAYTVALPGGYGTIHEIFDKATALWLDKTEFPSQKQIVIVDPDHFYRSEFGLKAFIDDVFHKGSPANYSVKKLGKMDKAEFLELFTFVDSPEEVIEKLMDPNVPWTPGIAPKPDKGIISLVLFKVKKMLS